jgi:hypothetical protein
MLRLVHDAEDIIQDSYLRAGVPTTSSKTGRHCALGCISNARVSHRAATPPPNACGPSRLCGPTDDPHTEPTPAGPEVAWLQPIPGGAAVVKRTL